MLCAGTEVKLPPPQPFRSCEPTLSSDSEDLEAIGDQLEIGTDKAGDWM